MTMMKPPPCNQTPDPEPQQIRLKYITLQRYFFSFKPILRLEKGLNAVIERSEGREMTDKNVRVNANKSFSPCPASPGHLR